MDNPSPNPEERFRDLFKQLDHHFAWQAFLSAKHLAIVRHAAADSESWRAFLAGNPHHQELPQPDNAEQKKPLLPSDSKSGEKSESEDQKPVENENKPVPAVDPACKDVALPGASAEPNSAAVPTPSSSPLPARIKPIPGESPAKRTPLSSPRSRRDYLFKYGRPDKDNFTILSAIVRRRLAVASVDEQLFYNVPGALPLDDARYEIDVGMLEGDDAGYASFEELQREEEATRTCNTGAYVLLGCDEDEDVMPFDFVPSDERGSPGLQSKERYVRSTPTPKRPRRATAAFGLSDNMERFVRELRELCEPHRDAARVESAQKRDVPKNIHRKAVSAASVVEELKEMEYKAHIGKYERVEECISAVSSCIGNQDKTFAEVLTQIEDRADDLREEYRIRKERHLALVRVKTLTTGILGSDVEWLESMDEDDSDEEMPDQDTSQGNGGWNTAQHAMSIPFAESDLKCWPAISESPILHVNPDQPRLPVFDSAVHQSKVSSDKDKHENKKSPTNLVRMLGSENHILKSILLLHRVRRLREQVSLHWDLLNRKRLAMQTSNNSPPQPSSRSPVKMEDVLPTNAATPKGSSVPASRAIDGIAKADVVEYFEIRNDALDVNSKTPNAFPGESRERWMGRSVVALMFAHAGYKYSSSVAIEVLTDVLEDFVERVGRSLVSCRENIDQSISEVDSDGVSLRNPSREEVFEELELVCDSGFQGNFHDLQGYARYDILRNEQVLREAELRLRANFMKLNQEIAKMDARKAKSTSPVAPLDSQPSSATPKQTEGSEPAAVSSEKDIHLDDIAFTFGHLGNGVRLDVLGAIKVPHKLASNSTEMEDVTMDPVPVSDKQEDRNKGLEKAGTPPDSESAKS